MSQLNMCDLFELCLEAKPPYFDEKMTKKASKTYQKWPKKCQKRPREMQDGGKIPEDLMS